MIMNNYEKTMVLLKNNNILPLHTCAGLVVLGDVENYTVGGGSGRVVGRTVSLADAFETHCENVEAYADLESEKAQDAVAKATNVLVVTGSQSTEGADRSTLALDGEALIEEASTLNPHIIVACAAPGASRNLISVASRSAAIRFRSTSAGSSSSVGGAAAGRVRHGRGPGRLPHRMA